MALVVDAVRDLLPVARYADRAAVFGALDAFLSACAVPHWFAATVPMPGGDMRHAVLRSACPEAFLALYVRDALWREDPLLQATLGSRAATRELDLPSVPPRGADVLALFAEYGMARLVGIPCVRVGAFQVYVACATETERPHDDVRLMAAGVRGLIGQLHEVAPELLARPGQLTARERQVVSMTARGLTSNEIADELGISARTVFAHLTSAGDKLRASNKTETVVNAFRYGQVSL